MSEQEIHSEQEPHDDGPKTGERSRRWRPTRRGFLIGLGAGGVGVALAARFGLPILHLRVADSMVAEGGDSPFEPPTNDPLAWFELRPGEPMRLYLAKIEMGQGVHTALAMIAAEELELPLEALEVVQASTATGPGDSFGTSGSTSIAVTYQPLREAAATLRELLRAEASRRLGVPADELTARDGAFFPTGANDQASAIAYADLVDDTSAWEVPEDPPPLKPPSEFRLVGGPARRVDLPAKVSGAAGYGYDLRVEGMKYGAIARPPSIGATLRRAAPGTAADQPGVVAVVIDEKAELAGVVADSRLEAQAALRSLDIEWDEKEPVQQSDIDAAVTVRDGDDTTIQRKGDAPRALTEETSLSAEFRTPMAAHASLEPQAALADVREDGAEIWVSTQMQDMIRGPIAKALDLDVERVTVTPTYVGGGFGRKWGQDVGLEAARLSRGAGVPVHVGWTRAEEMRHGYVRPPTHHVLRARLRDGRIEAIEHRQASGQVAGTFIPGFVMFMMGSDFGAWRGGRLMYDAPHVHAAARDEKLSVATGWWRGLGLLANVFAIESFMDELAHAAGADPLTFRLEHLSDEGIGSRMKRVLEAAAERAGWGGALPPDRALGIAACTDAGTEVACVAEVSLGDSGEPIVHRITAAMDCGRVIHPDGAIAQVQGNVMWGVGSALIEELTVADGQIVAGNFDRYPLLTISQAPEIDVVLLETEGAAPSGVGEPPIGPVAPAIANALFALTGARVRQLPITAERLVAARGEAV